MKLALIATLLITISCTASDEEQTLLKKRRDRFEGLLNKTCVPDSMFWGSLCRVKVKDKESCWMDKGHSGVAVNCSVFYEMKKVLDGLDSE